jgi:hypothetical protein
MKIFNSSGDTIVEVLIAMTVLASVIGGAYAVSNRAMISSQQSQERIQATKIAQDQLDKLKYISAGSTEEYDKIVSAYTDSDDTLQKFCINDNGKVKVYTDPECLIDDLYNLIFEIEHYGDEPNLFTLKIEWDSFRSTSKDNVTMYYKVYSL